uniref:Uncharacterized protein n=1 Tax=Chromera velia CCMP2878 TaxID=1169474 RepID=A0A0G4F7B1_9ALVE|eukprot:Cvel_15437.t1-p1 / transcript=Cvel_15437.t1 / gene=Cvel_15437 / organism=Chromera_velia_CCMP2878 / gene_product=hypothetical protein / transcript_product=hypothetical protein / location=Cvel_scaffold1142:978-1529(-) / protein_length=184 / sequence_SO=supercontig / SO=protein_coding / is_pseudo=false
MYNSTQPQPLGNGGNRPMPIIGSGSVPQSAVNAETDKERKQEQCAKITFFLSWLILPGCGNFAYHKFMNPAVQGSMREKWARWSCWMASGVCAAVVLIVVFVTLAEMIWVAWLILALFCVALIVACVFPRSREMLFGIVRRNQGQQAAGAPAPQGGSGIPPPLQGAGEIHYQKDKDGQPSKLPF